MRSPFIRCRPKPALFLFLIRGLSFLYVGSRFRKIVDRFGDEACVTGVAQLLRRQFAAANPSQVIKAYKRMKMTRAVQFTSGMA